jgi:predicted hydrocarbon binding protein
LEEITMPLKEKVPNQIFYLACTAVEDVMGKNGINSILNYSGLQKYIGNYPPNDLNLEIDSIDFTKLATGLVKIMGEGGCRSLMLRGGITGFEIMHRDFPSLFNIDGLKIEERTPDKLFDELIRIKGIMIAAAGGLFGEDIYKRDERTDQLAYEIGPCFWCRGVKAKTAICHGEIGFNIATARLVLGRDTEVEETHCIAKGDPACRFVIHRPKS